MGSQVGLGQALQDFSDGLTIEQQRGLVEALLKSFREHNQGTSNAPDTAGNVTSATGTDQITTQKKSIRVAGKGKGRIDRRAELRAAGRHHARTSRNKNRKPLNSFMGYRSYMGKAFKGMTQKVKSGLIRNLWQDEMDKSIWVVLGKAYSDIRDRCVLDSLEMVTLDQFLATAAPFIGLIPAEAYLEAKGWTVVTNSNGEPELKNIGAGSVQGEIPSLKDNVSVHDILEHCYSVGLAPRPAGGQGRRQNKHDARQAVAVSYMALPNSGDAASGSANTTTTEKPVSQEESINNNEREVVQQNPTLPLRYDEVFIEQQNVLRASGEDYPFNMQFHPGTRQPAIGVDLDMLQDPFDPFDITAPLIGAPYELVDWVDWNDGFPEDT